MQTIKDFPGMTFGGKRAFCRAKQEAHFNRLVEEFNLGLSRHTTLDDHLYWHSVTLPDAIVAGFLRRYRAGTLSRRTTVV